MDVKFDLSDCDEFIKQGKQEVVRVMESVGKEAVDNAISIGDYKNQTGTLRASNKSQADENYLTLTNEAEYASYVEKKGYEVLSSSALYAEKRLKEELE